MNEAITITRSQLISAFDRWDTDYINHPELYTDEVDENSSSDKADYLISLLADKDYVVSVEYKNKTQGGGGSNP